jgi:predicted DNA-binding protein with PD1-like motif
MRVRTLSGQPQKTHVVILDRGEEVSATLASFAASEDIRSRSAIRRSRCASRWRCSR